MVLLFQIGPDALKTGLFTDVISHLNTSAELSRFNLHVSYFYPLK